MKHNHPWVPGWRIDWDLLPIVGDHVYHPAFAGSYSLKAVLSALISEMSYEGTEVANGQDAGLTWESLGAWCAETWMEPTAKRPGRRCWIIADRRRWRSSSCYRDSR